MWLKYSGIMTAKDTFFLKKRTLNFHGKLFDLQYPIIMGIINLTPDSFYEGSRSINEKDIINRCSTLITEGAQIIDLGAYSTRPGAKYVSETEELNRLVPALKAIRKEFSDVILSIDTFRSKIAKIAVEDYNIQLINDISGGSLDENMLKTIASLKIPFILMHLKGNLQTMHQKWDYQDIMLEMMQYFSEKIENSKELGITDLIIDPGFGFSKTFENNYHILAHLEELRIFELPLLVGLSRKSMIYKFLEISPEESLTGTSVVNTIALLKGADILRVHDVKATVETIKIVSAYKNAYI